MEGPSYTAATMALQRALESNRRSDDRLFVDPYAEAFTSGSLRLLARLSRVAVLGRAAPLLFDLVGGPGPRPSAVARTRLIDDSVVAAADAVDQVVLLGAGFDTRAHRIPALAGVEVFEVDHPATQAVKRRVVDELGLVAPNIVYVPVDLEHEALGPALAAGLRTDTTVLCLWEGVTNYLTAEAVDGTLDAVRRLGVAGSRLLFTYVDARAIADPAAFPEARRWTANVRHAGEPWIFGLDPATVDEFLARRGYRLVADVSTEEAGARWFPALGRRERGSALYHVAEAHTV